MPPRVDGGRVRRGPDRLRHGVREPALRGGDRITEGSPHARQDPGHDYRTPGRADSSSTPATTWWSSARPPARAPRHPGPWLRYVWTVRDGQAVRFCWFSDPAEASKRSGCSPRLLTAGHRARRDGRVPPRRRPRLASVILGRRCRRRTSRSFGAGTSTGWPAVRSVPIPISSGMFQARLARPADLRRSRGRQPVQRSGRMQWDGWEIEVEDYLDAGERVVVILNQRGRRRSHGDSRGTCGSPRCGRSRTDRRSGCRCTRDGGSPRSRGAVRVAANRRPATTLPRRGQHQPVQERHPHRGRRHRSSRSSSSSTSSPARVGLSCAPSSSAPADGAVIDKTFRAGEKFRAVRTETRKMQFLYADGTDAHFMDTETYEQIDDPAGAGRRRRSMDPAERGGRRALRRRRAAGHAAAERGRARGDRDRARPAAATRPRAAATSRPRSRPGVDGAGAAVRERRRPRARRHPLAASTCRAPRSRCAAPTSDAPRSSRSTSATSPAARSRSCSSRDAQPFTRELVDGVRARPARARRADRAPRRGLDARPHRAARAQHPARGAVRAASPRRTCPTRSRSTRPSRPPRSCAAPRRPASSTASWARSQRDGGGAAMSDPTARGARRAELERRGRRGCARATSSPRTRRPTASSAARSWPRGVGASSTRTAREPRRSGCPARSSCSERRRRSAAYPVALQQRVDAYLAELRFAREPRPGGLEEAMRYSLLAGGKRHPPGAGARHGRGARPRPRRGAAARRRDRADPHLLADPRRPAGDGRRRPAPRQAHLPRGLRRGRRDPRRRRPVRRGAAPRARASSAASPRDVLAALRES